MKIALGCDHVSTDLKYILMDYLKEKGFECVDFGPYTSEERVNYPDYGLKVEKQLLVENDKGVLVCERSWNFQQQIRCRN